MDAIKVIAEVDEQHRLSARVPENIRPGRVTILIMPASDEDEAGDAWMEGIGHEWEDELADIRQDIYTLADGEPVDES